MTKKSSEIQSPW